MSEMSSEDAVAEAVAIQACAQALAPLSVEVRSRVVDWILEHFDLGEEKVEEEEDATEEALPEPTPPKTEAPKSAPSREKVRSAVARVDAGGSPKAAAESAGVTEDELANANPNTVRVLRLLRDRGRVKISAIAEALRLDEKKAYGFMQSLKGSKLVNVDADGGVVVWFATARGLLLVEDAA